MEPTAPSRTERQPLLRPVSPRPAGEDDQLSPSEAHYAHEHDTSHTRPPETTPKVLATCLSFLLLGLMVSTAGVALLAPVGYLAAALLNEPIQRTFGQRGIAVIAPACQVLMAVLAAAHYDPPRHVDLGYFLVLAIVGSFGFGLVHCSWSAWAGGLGGRRRNTVQGLLHGSYSVGRGLAPVVAPLASRGWQWWFSIAGAAVLQGLLLCWALRFENGRRYCEENRALRPGEVHGASGVRVAARPRGVLEHTVTWICAVYFLVYVGTEVAISGWIFPFMLIARHATTRLALLTYSGFWIGMAAGRIVLAPVTDKLGVRRTAPLYLLMAVASQCVFAAVNRLVVSIIAVILVGFFLGPLFPSGIVMTTGLLPKELHVGAVSFVIFVGQLGAAFVAVLFVIPVLVQYIRVSQAIVLAMLTVTLLMWLLFTRLPEGEREGEGLDANETANRSLDVPG